MERAGIEFGAGKGGFAFRQSERLGRDFHAEIGRQGNARTGIAKREMHPIPLADMGCVVERKAGISRPAMSEAHAFEGGPDFLD